jgi:RNA polymerase sigma-70 factor, ECF subfamily
MRLSREQFVRLALAELDAVDRVARHLARRGGESDDLVQETYARALKAADTFDLGDLGIRPWLLRILHNLYISRGQREARGPKAIDAALLDLRPAEQARADPDSGAALRFEDAALDHAFSTLSDDLRVTLLLWAIDELSYREIAEVTGVPIGTVMSRLHRARGRLTGRSTKSSGGGE